VLNSLRFQDVNEHHFRFYRLIDDLEAKEICFKTIIMNYFHGYYHLFESPGVTVSPAGMAGQG
jgi:hypothetical protein